MKNLLLLAILTSHLACGGAEKVTGPAPVSLRITQDLGVGYVLQGATPQPVVQLIGADGEPVARAGVVVTAEVPQGDVKVVAGGTATTNDRGQAQFQGLTFGALEANSGEFEVRYTSPGLVSASEFEAITCRLGQVPLNATVTADLKDGDCLSDGARYRYYDELEELTDNRTAIRVTHTAQGFAPAVYIRKRHDFDRGFFGFGADGPGSVSFKMLVPLQQGIRFMASSSQPNAFGPFQLRVEGVPDNEGGCEPVIIQTPVHTAQYLEAGCTDDEGNVGDYFPFMLEPGRTIDVTISTDAFTPYVSIWTYEPNQRHAYSTAVGAASVSYQQNLGSTQLFYIFVGSSTGTGVGTYTIQIGASPMVLLRAPPANTAPVLLRGPFKGRGGGPG